MNNGWVCLHRKLLEWEWYSDINTRCIFIHILLKATHTNIKWQGIEIKQGQLLTGRKTLAQENNISEQQVRTSLNRLKSTNDITIKSTNKYSIITVTNWNLYQDKTQQPNQQLTSNQPATNQQLTTYNKDNKDNKDNKKEKIYKKEKFKKPTIEEIKKYCVERKNSVSPDKFLNHYESNGWMVGKNKMKNWKAAVRTWEKNNFDKTKGQYNNYSKSYSEDIPL